MQSCLASGFLLVGLLILYIDCVQHQCESITLDVIVQAARLSDGRRLLTSITEVLGYEDGQIRTREVFTFQREGMDGKGNVLGKHMYIAESTFLERFYQVGALRRPGE